MDSPLDDGGRSAVEAFSILGNELRLAVLQALWEAPEDALPFAELRRRVDRDDGGNFNYHLNRLRGRFVRKTDEGYALRYAGEQVMRGILAGTVTADPVFEPTVVDERCPYCGAAVAVRYCEETLTVTCTECEGVIGGDYPQGTFMSYGFPPGGFDGRSLVEVVSAAHNLYDSKITPMMAGVCPECAGRVNLTFDVCEDHDAADGLCDACDARFAVWSTYVCERCKYRRQSAVWFKALTHPTVISFLHEWAGLEETVPFRKLAADNASIVQNITVSVRSTDPYRFRVRIPASGRVLLVDLDERLDVRSVETE